MEFMIFSLYVRNVSYKIINQKNAQPYRQNVIRVFVKSKIDFSLITFYKVVYIIYKV